MNALRNPSASHAAPRSRPLGAVLGRAALVACLLACTGPRPAAAQIRGNYLYTLSNFAGSIPYDWTRVAPDLERDETYVIYGNTVRIFNASGMETYSFGDDLDVGLIADVAVDRKGDIFLLSYKDSRPLVTRCDYRGVPTGILEVKKLPEGLVFGPNRMVYRNGLFYFVTTTGGSVIVTDEKGEFREQLDLFAVGELDKEPEKQRDGAEVTGFSVGADGSLYFTVAVLFRAFKVAPDRTVASFGRSGSAPGRFGVVAGIAADSRGNVVVADKLRCVVMVFDRNFAFVNEFGYRGNRPANLVLPDEVVIDKRDRVYVTQARRRGVSVFALAPN